MGDTTGKTMNHKRYFLFGESATKAYYNEEPVPTNEFEIFRFDPNSPDAVIELLQAYDGWDGWAEISSDEYESLKKIKEEQQCRG